MSPKKTGRRPRQPGIVRSRKNQKVQVFRRLDRDPEARELERILIAEGIKVLEVGLREGAGIQSLFVSRRLKKTSRGRSLLQGLAKGLIPPVVVSESVMDYLSGGPGHQGILATASRPPADLDSLLGSAPSPILFFIHEIQDPGNIGSTIRAADALGAAGVLLSTGSADPYGRRAVRASMGSIFRVPTLKRCDPAHTLPRILSAGFRCLATDPRQGTSLWEADLRGGIVILLGSEGTGLPPELLRFATDRIRIPMREGVDSLNVAATACLAGFEAARQRSKRS